MWLTTGTTAALARARTDNETLTSIKQGAPERADPAAGVAGPLEALAAVIPTGIAAFYTAAVLVIRGVALDEGASERAQATAKMVAAGDSDTVIAAALEAMPVETTAFVAARWVLLGFCLFTVAVMTFHSAQTGAKQATQTRKWVVAEPLTAIVAFVGWSLASPGTPLAAYFSTNEVVVYTMLIGTVAGLTVLGSAAFVLKNSAKSPDPVPVPVAGVVAAVNAP